LYNHYATIMGNGYYEPSHIARIPDIIMQ
jgi:hypothetical protein